MSQRNDQFIRVSLNTGQLILDALFMHCGDDSTETELEFYRLNPLVNSLHIPADDVYLLPVITEAEVQNQALLLWE